MTRRTAKNKTLAKNRSNYIIIVMTFRDVRSESRTGPKFPREKSQTGPSSRTMALLPSSSALNDL